MLALSFAAGERPIAGRKLNEWRDDCGALVAEGFCRDELRWLAWFGLGLFAFTPGSLQVQFWPDSDADRERVMDAFSRMLQPIILQALGWEALHASAALTPGGVVGFCGVSGSGKSTLAFAMQLAGWQQFADDSLVLRFGPDGITACPMPFRRGLRPPSRQHFEKLADLPRVAVPRHSSEIPLSAIFLLQQSAANSEPSISRLPKNRAFLDLLPHAHCFAPNEAADGERLVRRYMELAERVPIFAAKFGSGLHELPLLTQAVVEAAA